MTTISAEPALQSLSTTGPVFFPGDPDFSSEISPWLSSTVHHPDVVVGAACPEDVVAAVRYAINKGMTVAVQATGHGASTAVEGGVLISTRRMTGVSIDPQRRTARVAAGTKWAAVVAAAAPYGLAPLSGSTTDVGVVGYTLGGGLGPLGRLYGFAADQVLTAEIVTGDGLLRTVSADENGDLFWGLKGGKANFGIVTSLEIGLVPVARLYGGAMFFAGSDAGRVLHAWREWVETVPDEMTSSISLLRLPDIPDAPPPLRGRLSVHLRIAYAGDPAEGERLVAPMRAVAPVVIDGVRDMPFTEVDSIHLDPVDPTPAWENARLLTGLPPEAVDALLETAGPDVDVPLVFAEIRHMGGALSREPAVPSAVSGRDAAFSVMVLGPVAPGLEELVPAAGQRVLDAVAPWHCDQRLVNFIGHEVEPGQVLAAYPRAFAAGLRELKARFDPHNLFRHGPALPAVPSMPSVPLRSQR